MSNRSKTRKTELSLDKATGRFAAKIGRKHTSGGKIDGHKFRFSNDKRESERRKLRIQDLWDSLVDQNGGGTLWDEKALQIAKALAEGHRTVPISAEQVAPGELVRLQGNGRLFSQARLYSVEISRLQQPFPSIVIVAEDAEL